VAVVTREWLSASEPWAKASFSPSSRGSRRQTPLFDLLRSKDSAKAHIVYDGGRFGYNRNMVARNVTDWFDRCLGPVR